ncbi:4'-phosphopantetheinyl transferase family protein [Primorskyibacter sp. 2E107]|uniref:4'-phosphopantetheinyl transferase family protein n=1 Tax=Primorskyibacter sp. 2E107 TaxID=3403458 RepID=UPI003AF7E0E1
MTAAFLTDLPRLSDGFLRDARQSAVGGGVLIRATFDLDRFDPVLFETFGVSRPERLQRAVPKRLGEFLAGRVLAMAAQQALGRVPAPVEISDNRAPIWPDGLHGSITHSGGHCACLILPSPQGYPGIDIEHFLSGRSLASVNKLVLQEQDRTMIAASPLPRDQAATLCFSAKETLFKALHPTVGRFFGFEAAVLGAPPTASHLRLTLTGDLHDRLPGGATFDLTCAIEDRRVLTHMRYVP